MSAAAAARLRPARRLLAPAPKVATTRPISVTRRDARRRRTSGDRGRPSSGPVCRRPGTRGKCRRRGPRARGRRRAAKRNGSARSAAARAVPRPRRPTGRARARAFNRGAGRARVPATGPGPSSSPCARRTTRSRARGRGAARRGGAPAVTDAARIREHRESSPGVAVGEVLGERHGGRAGLVDRGAHLLTQWRPPARPRWRECGTDGLLLRPSLRAPRTTASSRSRRFSADARPSRPRASTRVWRTASTRLELLQSRRCAARGP